MASDTIPRDILVAESDAQSQAHLLYVLNKEGHRPVFVATGDEALDALEESIFDLVILASELPDMQGLDVFKAYQYIKYSHLTTPFIMLSSGGAAELDEFAKFGVHSIIPKPVTDDSLLATIDALTKEPQVAPAAQSLPVPEPVIPTPSVGGVSAEILHVPLMDFEQLERVFSLYPDRAGLEAITDSFIAEAEHGLRKIEVNLVLNQVQNAQQAAHALKGSAQAIGAVSLSRICSYVETTDDHEILAVRQELLPAFREAVSATIEAVRKRVESRKRD
ncbi:response regulator [Noviherbaspirillum galbum]|uniref:Response regulator n=1 Tax=Noviherbaspirillum galbum TaxID=2709383 RepID=A0A6B3SGS1_9BURK|nr:response regulator [Noviherbaspirillum galbum]NEX60051.1 response regulator [Noviherbaspirillum galbum]